MALVNSSYDAIGFDKSSGIFSLYYRFGGNSRKSETR